MHVQKKYLESTQLFPLLFVLVVVSVQQGSFFARKSFFVSNSYFSDFSWAMSRNFIQRLFLGFVAAFLRSMYYVHIYYLLKN